MSTVQIHNCRFSILLRFGRVEIRVDSEKPDQLWCSGRPIWIILILLSAEAPPHDLVRAFFPWGSIYGFSREDVGRSAASSQNLHNSGAHQLALWTFRRHYPAGDQVKMLETLSESSQLFTLRGRVSAVSHTFKYICKFPLSLTWTELFANSPNRRLTLSVLSRHQEAIKGFFLLGDSRT